MSTTFVGKPIKGFCYVQVPDHTFFHREQCSCLSKYAMTDGFNQVEVCGTHRNLLLRHNEIWKTQWRELQSGEEPQTELKKDVSKMSEREMRKEITRLRELLDDRHNLEKGT